MASGAVTGWQHQLIDMPELTKETFIQFCDENFYHLDRFGETVEQAKVRYERRKKEVESKYHEAVEELEQMTQRSGEQWMEEYYLYVERTKTDNEYYKEAFEKESERFNQIVEYAEEMRPYLNYIWDKLEEPKLYQSKIQTFTEYVWASFEAQRSTVEFRKDDLDRLEKDDYKDQQTFIQNYELKKAEFLSDGVDKDE